VQIKMFATLDECAGAIMALIGLDATNAVERKKIATFIRCNGYLPVWRAAERTRDYVTRGGTLRNPWQYTVAVFNTNLAFLSLLYPLTHWVESGLRSQLDLYQAGMYGSTWYQLPTRYLRGNQLDYFVNDATMPAVVWDQTTRGAGGRTIAAFSTSADFLEAVNFGWLLQMIVFCHGREPAKLLVPPDGVPLASSALDLLLAAAKEARNDVAHHHFLDDARFSRLHNALNKLLVILHFDVERALKNVEGRRQQIQHRQLSQVAPRP
jgi:hypothetical protein